MSNIVDQLKRNIKRRYWVAISGIAILGAIAQIVIQVQLSRQMNDAETINLAGRQRMISQRLVQHVLALKSGATDLANIRHKIEKEIRLFEDTHNKLKTGTLNASAANLADHRTKRLFSELERPFSEILEYANSVLSQNPAQVSTKSLLLSSDLFLEKMNSIVKVYESNSEASVIRVRFIEIGIFFLTLVFLLVEVFVIFRPIINVMEKGFKLAIAEKEENDRNSSLVELGRLNSVIAHELRNFLTIIHANSQIIDRITSDKDVRSRNAKIMKNVTRCEKALENSRTMARKEKSELTEVLPGDIFEEFLEIVHQNEDQAFKVSVENNLADNLYCNRVALLQVLLNLYRNARDKSGDRGGEGWLRVRAYSTGPVSIIEFTDSGDGISDEIASRMFEPFFTTKSDTRGTGIGLDVCKEIVETQHEGRLYYNSKAKNTQFIIELPATQSGQLAA